jgi:hypothetical protein
MRSSARLGAVVGMFAVVGCSLDVNLGNRVKPRDAVTGLTAPGNPCNQNSDCMSALCLGSTCCTGSTCGTDATCQGTSCDATGACVYPAGSCGTPACSANQLTVSSCAQGACVAGAPSACPGNLTCANATSCRGSCTQTSDCVSGYYCSSGSCLPQLAAGGGCTSSDACLTGICGVSGSGHCCTTTCVSGDPYGCGASDCDATGACVYPPASTSCIALACSGHLLTEPASCNGAGSCPIPAPATVDCAPYPCGSTIACATSCATSADCWEGFCLTAKSVCCSALTANTIQVDGTQGVDQDCCGSGAGASACATIAYAVQEAGQVGAPGVTIAVANPPNGSDWVADSSPIQLSYGVILSAPGIYFTFQGTTPSDYTSLFIIDQFGSEPAASAVIEGSAAAPTVLGADSTGKRLDNPTIVYMIDVKPRATLHLLDATLLGSRWVAGILVEEAATLNVGADGLGGSGTVRIGEPGEPGVYYAITCGAYRPPGYDGGAFATVNDTGSTASPSLSIQNLAQLNDAGAESVAITGDYCNLSLTAHPQFGMELLDGGCPSWDGQAVLWVDPGDIVLNHAQVQCQRIGIQIPWWTGATFSGDSDLIQNNTFAGVYISSGTFTNSTITHNGYGIFMNGGGTLDLSGGGNQLSCNSTGDPTNPGADLVVSGTALAGKVAWDDWDSSAGHTQIWSCLNSQCTCSGAASCPAGTQAQPDGADIVLDAAALDAGVDDTGGSLVASPCL